VIHLITYSQSTFNRFHLIFEYETLEIPLKSCFGVNGQQLVS
jgi:hypothetical protein